MALNRVQGWRHSQMRGNSLKTQLGGSSSGSGKAAVNTYCGSAPAGCSSFFLCHTRRGPWGRHKARSGPAVPRAQQGSHLSTT